MTTVLQVLVMLFVASVSGNKRANNKVKQMIEDAGCTFVDSRQLLVRNVCLKPNYQSNELPTNDGFEKTFVDIYLHEAKVLDIDEMKDKITIKLSQLMEWSEPRIRANFSAISKEVAQIKLSSKNIKSLWYPDLDMYTKDLEDWKSLYHPLLYQEVVVTKDPFLNQRHNKKNNNVISIHAWKDWVATIYCHFDFSSFPLDTQHCRFRQMGTSESVQPLLYPSLDIENWHYKSGGFEVKIDPVEAFKGKDIISQPNKTIDEIGFNVTLQRIVHPYLYQYYFPCFAIVIVSQISFIIPISAIPGRVALVVTQFLTLTNIFIHLMVSILNRNEYMVFVFSNNNIICQLRLFLHKFSYVLFVTGRQSFRGKS